MKRYTITQFREDYPNDDACLHKLYKLRFTGLICPKCSSDNEFKRVKGRRSYQCPGCGFQLYPTQGTVFEKSTTPLTYWFYAIFLQTTTRNGVAAKELERQLDISYKTALRMAHQIKKLMADKEQTQLAGIVELDETFIGGKGEYMHAKKRKELIKSGRGYVNMTPVFGMLERGGGVKAFVVPLANSITLQPIAKKSIKPEAVIVTDGFSGYNGIDRHFKGHIAVSHGNGEYVIDKYHTNSIEGFWTLLKRTIKGTHIHVSTRHLQKYIDEVAFRYAYRDKQDIMFEAVLQRV